MLIRALKKIKEDIKVIFSGQKDNLRKDVIDAIHTAGGIAILAHPVKSGCTEILDDYIEYGIDGIEVFHPSTNEDEQAELKKFATKNKLLMTGGSDFHSEEKQTLGYGNFRKTK